MFLTILINLGSLNSIISNKTGHIVAYIKKYSSNPAFSKQYGVV
jgi:hypothetical protein